MCVCVNWQVRMGGRNVFMGYLNMKDKTLEVFDDDLCLKSGDIGKKDDDGFLFITGRIKGQSVILIQLLMRLCRHRRCMWPSCHPTYPLGAGKVKSKGQVLDIALFHDEHMLCSTSTLQSRKWQLIGMS